MNCGLLKKGSTCYISALLQSFIPMIKLLSKFSLRNNTLSPLVSSLIQTISLLSSGKTVLGTSQSLRCLKNAMNSSGKCDFSFSSSRAHVRLCLVYLKIVSGVTSCTGYGENHIEKSGFMQQLH